ncbi:MAG: hypothetical protein CSA75_04030, partial [Sorangium cellulosum]
DRYVRAFTAQLDLDIPLNVIVSSEGITPVMEKINVSNATVTHADLLTEDPASVASALASVMEGFAGSFLGSLSSFQVSDVLERFGFSLDLRQEGIMRLRKGDDNFVGLFANLKPASATTSLRSETTAEILEKFTRVEGFRLGTANDANRPRVAVRASASAPNGRNTFEYTYKLDNGLWHTWRKDNEWQIDDPYLLMQGVHTIAIKSRISGRHETEDRSPALLQVRIDVDPPIIETKKSGGKLKVDAWDLISSRSNLSVRYLFEGQSKGKWVNIDDLEALTLAQAASLVAVEVRDEEGNVAHKQQKLIQEPKTLSDSSSGCSIERRSHQSVGSVMLALGLALGLALRVRQRRKEENRLCRSMLSGVAVLVIAGSWTGCSCSDETETIETTPPTKCGEGDFDPCIELEPGLIGSYTSAAVAPDGTLWVAGYNEADWEQNVRYGDLVVGKWNGSTVDWKSIDGVPEQEVDKTIYDIESWRGGNDEPGVDVGQWTTMQFDGEGNPQIAYWDRTNKALKFASFDGKQWTSSYVYEDKSAEAGRYAKMLIVEGVPTIAFQVIKFGNSGFPVSTVVVGRALSSHPSSPSDWTFKDVAIETSTPCRDQYCVGTQKCFKETEQCSEPTNDCNPQCGTGMGCLNGVCLDLLDGTKLDTYPDAIGDYVSFAAGPSGELGIVYY